MQQHVGGCAQEGQRRIRLHDPLGDGRSHGGNLDPERRPQTKRCKTTGASFLVRELPEGRSVRIQQLVSRGWRGEVAFLDV